MIFWQGKHVLVTGGTGFIGSYVTEMLVQFGAKVRVPTRNTKPSNARITADTLLAIDLVEADLKIYADCIEVVRGVDIVINLAADVGGINYNVEHPASIFRNNLSVFMNVIEASRVCGIDRFLAVSSACVYRRDCSIPTPESEGFTGIPEPTNRGYGWAKRMEEFVSEAYAQQYKMKIGIARPYNAYGPRDNFSNSNSHVIPALIRRVAQAENPLIVWGDGSQTRSFLYAEDFARGLLLVIEKYAEADVLNIGSDEEVTIADLSEMIIAIGGGHQTVQFDTSKPGGQPRRVCDTAKAKGKIGFVPQVSLRDGLERTYKYFESIGKA